MNSRRFVYHPVCIVLFVILVVIASGGQQAFGQNLATWSFGSTSSPSPVAANVTASNAAYTTPNSNTSILSNRFRAQGWDVPSFDPARYFEVKITPNVPYLLTVTQFAFNVQNAATSGPQFYEVRISTDGFTSFTAIGNGAVTAAATNVIFPVSTVVMTNATLAVRAFFWGATDPARTISIGSATINGTVQQPALPVGLLNFRGKPAANGVELTWATAWERAADRYVVQQSQNAEVFREVGTLPAMGTTDGQRTYALTDGQPTEGINYYRLKQIDQDQSYTYSKIIAVQVRTDQPAARVYPNPSGGQEIHVQVRCLPATTATVYTLTGRVLSGTWLRLSDVDATWQPDVPLAAGTYLLSIGDGANRQAVKVLVE